MDKIQFKMTGYFICLDKLVSMYENIVLEYT